MRRKTLLLAAAFALSASPAFAAGAPKIVRAFPGVSFERPVCLEAPRDGSGRLFVAEQPGVIRVFKAAEGVSESEIFLDLRARVAYDQNEEGLLGLAFHPRYAENGYFYVNFTAPGPLRTVVARFKADPSDPDRADPSSFKVLLEVPQPYSNHNGGQTSFGPDGFLYVGLGDGGAGGDPHGNGQNRKTLLGKILRVDVDAASDGRAYGIPAGNPFKGNKEGFREEIFAWGLRNPWRFSWDGKGRLWCADVGQNRREEIDVIRPGRNYGWNVTEGKLCFKPRESCDRTGLEPPVWDYGREEGGCVTGGFAYRGKSAPSLAGAYVYADFLSGKIWALRLEGGAKNALYLQTDKQIASFGEGPDGELYVCAFDGGLYRLDEGGA